MGAGASSPEQVGALRKANILEIDAQQNGMDEVPCEVSAVEPLELTDDSIVVPTTPKSAPPRIAKKKVISASVTGNGRENAVDIHAVASATSKISTMDPAKISEDLPSRGSSGEIPMLALAGVSVHHTDKPTHLESFGDQASPSASPQLPRVDHLPDPLSLPKPPPSTPARSPGGDAAPDKTITKPSQHSADADGVGLSGFFSPRASLPPEIPQRISVGNLPESHGSQSSHVTGHRDTSNNSKAIRDNTTHPRQISSGTDPTFVTDTRSPPRSVSPGSLLVPSLALLLSAPLPPLADASPTSPSSHQSVQHQLSGWIIVSKEDEAAAAAAAAAKAEEQTPAAAVIRRMTGTLVEAADPRDEKAEGLETLWQAYSPRLESLHSRNARLPKPMANLWTAYSSTDAAPPGPGDEEESIQEEAILDDLETVGSSRDPLSAASSLAAIPRLSRLLSSHPNHSSPLLAAAAAAQVRAGRDGDADCGSDGVASSAAGKVSGSGVAKLPPLRSVRPPAPEPEPDRVHKRPVDLTGTDDKTLVWDLDLDVETWVQS